MISEVFIRRPVTSIVISILITLIGAISITTLPVSQYPNITPPTVNVSANYTGADAETVEQTVTTFIERQIHGKPGMSAISSKSTSNGRQKTNFTVNGGPKHLIPTADR